MENVLAAAQSNSLQNMQNTIAQAKEYIQQAKAQNTKKAYKKDWAHFCIWCESNGLLSLPATPDTVALYLTTLASEEFKASTIQRRISSISQAHQVAGYESPTKSTPVRTVWAGIRRTHGTRQEGKAPAVIDDIRAMVNKLPNTLLGIRDRALLLLGFAGAFRRSELVGLDLQLVQFTREGLVITLPSSKTDQEGQGRKIGIPYGSNYETCPVRSLQSWLEASAITSGPLFRSVNRHGKLQEGRLSDKAVALVVKRCAEMAGLDSTKYSGHSLRSGLATSAAAAGVSERAIMNQTGHKSVNMVRRYIREGSLFRENAASSVGL